MLFCLTENRGVIVILEINFKQKTNEDNSCTKTLVNVNNIKINTSILMNNIIKYENYDNVDVIHTCNYCTHRVSHN